MVAKRILWALSAALLAPSLAHALGLGDIRLSSGLNQPLDAEIDLLNAAPDELAGLKASLASRETFARYGLDYPNFLTSVTLARGTSANGRDVLKIKSAETITEPFVSLLVEVSWGRGRLVREYTVLLDPPVFAPNSPARAADATVPATGSETSGSIVRPAPVDSTAQAAPAESTAAVDSYAVRRGDSLGAIARQLGGTVGVSQNQLMMGIYQANPEAFEGNMNQLRSGTILRIPDSSSLQAISGSAAASEVRRQYANWRGQSNSSASSSSGRLRLVAPGEAGDSGGATDSEVKGLRDRLAVLEGELAESKRLLELRNSELANLQKRLGSSGEPASASTSEPKSEPIVEPTVEPAAGTPTTEPVPEPSTAATPGAVPPAVAVPEEPMRARVRPSEDTSSPSFLDRALGLVRDFWYVPLALLALLAGLLGFRKFQAQRAANADGSLEPRYAEPEMSQELPAMSEPVRRVDPAPDNRMLVEESGQHLQPAFAKSYQTPERGSGESDPSATLSSDTAINFDQSDPLAEADFHMAYGLYDQAADLVRNAIGRDPSRLDLKLKLVEVFFVWGNKDEFLRLAKEIHESGAARSGGDWEKIVIMGRQIAPEETLFSQGAELKGLGGGSVDLDLVGSGGDNRIDFDMLGESGSNAVDLDLGKAQGDDSQEQKAVANFDIPLGRRDASGGTTREMAPEFSLPDQPDLTVDLAVGSEAPTVEQPALRSGSPTIREKIDAAMRMSPAVDDAAERTSEVAIDDLGLDIGDIEGLDIPDEATEALPDAPTMVSGLDNESRRIMSDAAKRKEDAALRKDSGATVSLAALDGAALGDLDFELSDKTQESPAFGARDSDSTAFHSPTRSNGLDVDLGAMDGGNTASVETLIADDVSLPPLEPVTMSEVGTKLDLARAYVDMGDPDGARNILQEVLQEGSHSQKQEAQRLLDAIPG